MCNYRMGDVAIFSGSYLCDENEWLHLSKRNNHQEVMEKFDTRIGKTKSGRNIAIIAEPYFQGDKCVSMAYLMKLMDGENILSISTGGVDQGLVLESFLSDADKYDFLVAFSKSSDKPDFSGLTRFCGRENIQLASKVIAEFKKFMVVDKDKLAPEDVNIFF